MKSSRNTPQAWKVNFANPETLPDIKPIRTSFVITYSAVFFFAVCGFFFVNQQIQIEHYYDQIDEIKKTVQNLNLKNQDALKLSQSFEESAEKGLDFESFFRGDFPFHEFFETLSIECPDEVVYEELNYQVELATVKSEKLLGGELTLKGLIKGSPEEALSLLDKYQGQLKEMPLMRERSKTIETAPGEHDQSKKQTQFTITIKMKPV